VDFADVGPPDDSHFHAVHFFFLFVRGHHIHAGQRGVEQIIDTGAVFGGDGKYRNAQFAKYVDAAFLRHSVHFVHGDHKFLARGTQHARQLFIERRQPRAAVYDQNQQRRLLDGHACLAKNFRWDQGLVVRHNAAGVDDFQRAAQPLGFAINAVAGDPRLVGDDGAARPSEAVEEGRFADVGPADDDERWQRGGHARLTIIERGTHPPILHKRYISLVLRGAFL